MRLRCATFGNQPCVARWTRCDRGGDRLHEATRADDCGEQNAPTGRVTLPKNVSFTAGPSSHILQREVNVIGKTEEDALEETERFLDQAMLAQVRLVRIVHGHGKGILRRAVQKMLSHHPNVAKFYPASSAEGGTGATIAELRED